MKTLKVFEFYMVDSKAINMSLLLKRLFPLRFTSTITLFKDMPVPSLLASSLSLNAVLLWARFNFSTYLFIAKNSEIITKAEGDKRQSYSVNSCIGN